jgi:DNA-binding LacI/PurR family transcriptional regulator
MQKRITIKDVALKAGVSYQTVSKVINGQIKVAPETRDRIWQAVQELGYQPDFTARSLRSRRSYTFGYSWAPTPRDQPNPILDQFLQSMFHAAERGGYYMLSFSHEDDPQKQIENYTRLINTGRVDGFILSRVEYDDPRVLFLLEEKFPFAAFGRSNPELDFPWVDVDGGQGIRMATEHLLDLGHRRIAALAWQPDSRVGNNRLEGYFQAMQAAGIRVLPQWIERGEGHYAFGYEATRALLSLPDGQRPSAVVCLNDPMATGCLRSARDLGLRVPADLAVTGFDDFPLVQFFDPPLTSVHQPIWEVGQHIIALLLDWIENGQPAQMRHTLLQPELIVRGSSRP